MLRPLPVKVDSFEIHYWRWWLEPGATGTFTCPKVLTAAWQSPAGARAALFANISQDAVPLEVTLLQANRPLTITRDRSKEHQTPRSGSVKTPATSAPA